MKKLSYAQKQHNKSVYKQIRKAFNSRVTRQDITYKQFKNRVLNDMVANDYTLKKAIRHQLNREAFVSPAERSRSNFTEALKEKFSDAWKELKNKSRENGKFKSVRNNLEWSMEKKGYILGGRYLVDIKNSPEEIVIIDLEERGNATIYKGRQG